MRVAQRLYEGVDLGGETAGLITYMRTDSVAMSRAATGAVRRLIRGEFGQDYLLSVRPVIDGGVFGLFDGRDAALG